MTLFRYVLHDFLKIVSGALSLCVFLFLLFDFIHKTTRYIPRYNPSIELLVEYYLYQIPGLLLQALPIASLLASVVTMVLLNRTNEITAMRAVGMGPALVGAPIALGGLLLSFVSIFLGEFVLPYTANKVHFIQEVRIENGAANELAEGARWVRDKTLLYNFRDFDPLSNRMDRVKIIEVGPGFRPKRTVEAGSATYRPVNGDWLLEDVKTMYFWPNGTLSYTQSEAQKSIKIPAEPSKLKRERRLPNELSLIELNEVIKKGEDSGRDILAYKVDMQIKMAFHFASFVVSLIGLKFGYKSERNIETARGVLMAIGVGVSYWFFLNSGRALGMQGELSPILAAWSANVIVLLFSWISILRVRKA